MGGFTGSQPLKHWLIGRDVDSAAARPAAAVQFRPTPNNTTSADIE